ncbi:MAG: DUF5020 family protein [Prevotella sp.]|nr:DUF5020 family protein [Prevotella sp.]
MRKTILSALMMLATCVSAQNVQLHYDFGRNIYSNEEAGRQKVTMTLEQFKADQWGSWFYFVDIDFSRKFTEAAYAEISREFNIGSKGFAAHVEYDGGLNKGGSFQQSALLGGAWNGHNADFSKTYSVQLMYKRYFKSYNYTNAYHSLQLTGVWGLNFADNWRFAGFIDFWRGEKANGHGQLVVLTEPQLWYNVNDHLSVGTEVEISDNFVYNLYNDKKFFVNPTIAAKWNF